MPVILIRPGTNGRLNRCPGMLPEPSSPGRPQDHGGVAFVDPEKRFQQWQQGQHGNDFGPRRKRRRKSGETVQWE